MLKLFSRFFSKIGNYFFVASYFLNMAGKTVVGRMQSKQVALWFANNGDQTLRLNYYLNENSVVFDLGGYKGQWASDIFSKYLCTIYIFEIYQIFAQNIEERFRENNKIKVFPFALSNHTGDELIKVSDDASSIYLKDGQTAPIKLIKASEFIAENKIQKIDLMKINIEGSEYDLLDHLIDSGIILMIDNIQIQFHYFHPDATNRMLKIHQHLTITHELTFQYKFVWENWKKKKS